MARYHVICDRCGFKYWNYEVSKEWTGLMVCHPCWDPRHPQEFLRGVKEKRVVPNPRPRPTDYFLSTNEVTPESL